MGAEAWGQFVKEMISYGRPMPIGAPDALARLYVRRSLLIAREIGPTKMCDRVKDLVAFDAVAENGRNSQSGPCEHHAAAGASRRADSTLQKEVSH